MAENTAIAWTHHTFNPVRGCAEVSPGCDHCYAKAMSLRNPATLGTWGPDGTRIIASESMWREPMKWHVRAAAIGERDRVFCASLADVFEDWQSPMGLPCGKAFPGASATAFLTDTGAFSLAPEMGRPATYQDVRNRLFALIEATPSLDWQLLTKRPQNVMRMVPAAWQKKFPPNVWMGTTVEDQQRADERIPALIAIPAAVRFLSIEPMLGELDIEEHLEDMCDADPSTYPPPIHWVIAGGESGPGHRSLDLAALENLAAQCTAAGVPLFVKQDSGPKPGQQGRISDALWSRKEFPRP